MELEELVVVDEMYTHLYKAMCVSARLSWANQWSQHELVEDTDETIVCT